ncbi:MAG: tol-pal system protein YbgF [Deltaproteobacteria bacterium]|nr:tol-pal system protein YbgF [Candidatus Zymogenaceae bacterium]
MGRIKKLPIVCAACLFCLAAGVPGCETTTGYMGSGDGAKIDEIRRSIIDLEKKVSELTREVAELDERTARNEKAVDAYVSGTVRKPVEEEVVGETPPKDAPAGGTASAPSDDTPSIRASEEPPGGGADTVKDAGVLGAGDAKDPQVLYDRALSEIMDRKAETALPLFVEFVNTYPSDELTDNASYWIGECYYLMNDYQKALDQFRGVTERFPDKDKAPDALLKMGYCYEKIGDAGGAREVYGKVITAFPDSEAADLARKKVK